MKPKALNNLIREHLTPEWALYQGRTYRILRIMDGIAYLDHTFGSYAVKLSEVEVY
jgi:hypothetical protein